MTIFYNYDFSIIFSYKKFTRGKDLSNARKEDLDCIFGRRKSKSAPVTPQGGSPVSQFNCLLLGAIESTTSFNRIILVHENVLFSKFTTNLLDMFAIAMYCKSTVFRVDLISQRGR